MALVEQPYRVAGRRSPPPASRLDTAWVEIVGALRADALEGLAVIVGGRSMGGRVACRTVDETGAVAVLCLAFPLEPPGRKTPQNRLPELDAVTVPTLVVQGERDPFGIPPPGPSREVATVPGDHGLKADPGAVAAAVRTWLASGRLKRARLYSISYADVAQLARASACHAEGRGFESHHPLSFPSRARKTLSQRGSALSTRKRG